MKKSFKPLFAGLVALFGAITLAGCSAGKSTSGTSTVTKNTAKTVSFVKESHSKGTYVWLTVAAPDGLAKDSLVTSINVLANGKLRAYQIFDSNVTLGRVSRMSDDATIKLAKAQNKKYATTGAISEVKAWEKAQKTGKDYQQVGQEADFDQSAQNAAGGQTDFYYRNKNDPEGSGGAAQISMYGMRVNEIDRFYRSYPLTDTDDVSSGELIDLKPNPISTKQNDYDRTPDPNFSNQIIGEIRHDKYQAPAPQKIKVKSTTDASGNHITVQKITYQTVAFFDGNQFSKKQYRLIQQHQNDFKTLVEISDDGSVPAASNDDVPRISEAGFAKQKQLYNKVIAPNYAKLMKGVYGYHPWNLTMQLDGPIHQQIYKERYIGYVLDNGQCLLTKAQTPKQRAVLK